MLDFLNQLRLKSIFPGQEIGNDLPSQGGITGRLPIPNPTAPTTMPTSMSTGPAPMQEVNPYIANNIVDPNQNVYNVQQRMNDLYSPDTKAEDRLNELLNSYPVREKPSFLRKIAAGLVAHHNGMDAGNQVFNNAGGFNNKLTDWKNQVEPTERAANIERQANANQRTAAYQTIAQELRQQAQDAKEANDAKKLEISQQRANVYEFKARNPGVKLMFPKGGNIQFVDPVSGKVTDSGIPTGTMTEMDKMNLGHDNRMEENEQKAGFTSDQIAQRGDESRKTAVVRGEENRKTKSTASGNKTGADKPELPTQTRVRQFNAARELANSRADLKQFIKVGAPGTNDFVITPPSDGFFGHSGPTAAQYKEINDFIYGKKPTPATSHEDTKVQPTTPQPKATTGTQPPLKPGYVRVQDPNGKTGQYPRNKVSQLGPGWKVIGGE